MPILKRVALVAALSALIVTSAASNASAVVAGDLDPSFGNGGLSSLAAPTNYNYGTFDTLVQPDGKILTAGYEQFMSGFTAIAVQRFNADGSLDLSFGGGDGVASTQPAISNSSAANAVEVAPDGSIFLGGYRVVQNSPYLSEFVVVKFTSAGVLDTSFDGDAANTCGPSAGNGVVCARVSTVTAQDQGRAMVLQADGKVVLIGSAYIDPAGPVRMAALRLTTTGALDATFDGDGRVTASAGVDQAGFSSYANSAAIQSDGKIVMGGVAQGEGNNHLGVNTYVNALGVVRLNTNGSVDAGFKYTQPGFSGPPTANGVVMSARTHWTYGSINDTAIQPDGKVVVTGYANDVSPSPTKSSVVAVRFMSNGEPDASFGTGGRAFLDLGGYSAGSRTVIDNAGKIYVTGHHYPDAFAVQYAARLTPSGTPDPDFSGVGWRAISWGPGVSSQSTGMAFVPDGKLLISGGGVGVPRSGFAKLITVGDPVIPTPPVADPFVKITSPKAKSQKAKKLKSLAGTAGPVGSVRKVEIALQRKDSKLLKKKKRCAWLSSAKAKFKQVKATKGKCSKPYYRGASGTSSWKYRIRRTLPKGSYVLTVRVTLSDGRTGLTTKSFKLK